MTADTKRLDDEVVERLERAAEFGESTSADGARLLGHVPHLAPEAWLHAIYPPLGEEEIAELEERLPHSFGEMLLSEIDRLADHYDEQGRERDPSRATTPPPS